MRMRMNVQILILGMTSCSVWGMCIEDGRNNSCHHVQKRNILFAEKTVCYGVVGCFSNGPPFFHPFYRPLSATPESPEIINTMLHLYTRRNRNRPIIIHPTRSARIKKSTFDPSTLTRVIIHGLLDRQSIATWFQRMKNVILDRADENVIIVDWSGSNRLPYTVTIANCRLVGAQVAYFIKYIYKTFGTSPESFHLIGHSLGAHIAGYAGERLYKLGRITGLDPAGPLFQNVAESVRLDPSDAVLVDVIHSDPGRTILRGFGSPEDVGDLDFYPGGGDPPGCDNTLLRSLAEDLSTEVVGNLLVCQHLRALEFFISSFNQNDCLMIGVECSSWKKFLSGYCNCGQNGEKCAIMGIFTPSYTFLSGKNYADRRYYLKVGLERPFCVHQYQVILYLHALAAYKTYGYETTYADVTVFGKSEKLKRKIKIDINLAETDQVKKILLATERSIGEIKSATIHLRKVSEDHEEIHTIKLYRKQTHTFVDKIEINYLFPLPKEHTSSKLCRISEEPYGHDEKRFVFSPRACY